MLLKSYEVIATGRGEQRQAFPDTNGFLYESMDFTDPLAVKKTFETHRPDVVVHAGAMSNVDECELNHVLAYKTNVEGTSTMLLNAKEHKCFFVFISTDFIFDGARGMYSEEDMPGPVNFYGKTKLDAEIAIKEYEYDWAIVRTVLVYGTPISAKQNILTIVKEKLEKGEEYSVVNDQVRTPTFVEDITQAIISIIEKKAKGVFHISGKDVLTPYDMACCVADFFGFNKSLIKKVTAADFSQPAKRPPITGFVIDKAVRELGFHPVAFEEGLRRTFS
jgi:dTDP-4-dehydrorhamnose reductase